MKDGLDKIADLVINNICTSHGPVLTKGCRIEYAIEKYTQWCKPKVNSVPTIPIFYTTAYGNTEKISESIKDGILSVIKNADVTLYNINDCGCDALTGVLNNSDAFLLGSPTINRDAVPPSWQILSHIDAINNQKKPCAVFGSFGWSGEAVPMLCERLRALKLNVFGDGLKINFVPSDEQLSQAVQFGKSFAESLEL